MLPLPSSASNMLPELSKANPLGVDNPEANVLRDPPA